MIRLISTLLLLSTLIGPSALAFDDSIEEFILAPIYKKSVAEYDSVPEEHLPELKFVSGAIVTTCREYLKIVEISEIAWDIRATDIIRCSYRDCHILDELAHRARPHKGYRPASYSKEIYNRLNWREGVLDGLVQFKSEGQQTLAQTGDPFVKLINRYKIERLEEKVWSMSLEVVADADLNGNGKPDWLFIQSEQALGGHLLSCASGIIWDVEPTGPIKAVMYPLEDQDKP